MTLDEAVQFYGSGRQICMALGISPQNYTHWRSRGFIPGLQQYRLEKLSEGKLKSDDGKRGITGV